MSMELETGHISTNGHMDDNGNMGENGHMSPSEPKAVDDEALTEPGSAGQEAEPATPGVPETDSEQTQEQEQEQDFGPPALSPSQLKLYDDCPKKWKFRYLEKLPDPPGLAAVIGTFAHSVLEALMNLPPEQRTQDIAQAIAGQKFDEISRDKDFQRLNLGKPAIARFKWRAWDSITKLWTIEDPQQVEVIDVEVKLTTKVSGVPFVGYIDRLDNSPQGLVINDYKSGKPNHPGPNSDPNQRHLEDSHVFQVMLYAAAVTEESSDMPAKVRVLYLGELNGQIAEEVTPAKLEDVQAKLVETWGRISDSRISQTFEAKPSILCGWCAFLAHCQEGMETVIQFNETGKLKDSAPAMKLKQILFNRGAGSATLDSA